MDEFIQSTFSTSQMGRQCNQEHCNLECIRLTYYIKQGILIVYANIVIYLKQLNLVIHGYENNSTFRTLVSCVRHWCALFESFNWLEIPLHDVITFICRCHCRKLYVNCWSCIDIQISVSHVNNDNASTDCVRSQMRLCAVFWYLSLTLQITDKLWRSPD